MKQVPKTDISNWNLQIFKQNIIELNSDLIRVFCFFFSLSRKPAERKQFIPSDAIIYLSYAFGDPHGRANLTMLSRNQVKQHVKRVKESQVDFIRVTQSEHRAAYAQFMLDVRNVLQNLIEVKSV